jgi:zinc protease
VLAVVLMALVSLPAPILASEGAVTRHVLANGLTVLVRERQEARVVAMSMQVGGGTRLESPETAGITNLLVRSMVRGTSRRTATEVAEAVEDLGGTIDAAGDVDHGEIRAQALARHWEALLTLVAEVTLDPALAPAEVERERRLVLAQIQTRVDNPQPAAIDTLLGQLYRGHPYAHPPTGRREAVERLGAESLRTHYAAIVRPERMVLAVSGAVPASRVVKAAERLLGRMAPKPAGASPPAPTPPRPTGGRQVVEKPAQQAQIVVGFLSPGVEAGDQPSVAVLATLLGGGMAGRLFVELRDRRGLAYALGVVHPLRASPAYVIASMGTVPANADAAEAGVLAELERVRGEPPSAAELARAKAYLLGRFAMDRRTHARQAWSLAYFESIGVGWDFPERYVRAVEAVTAADVQAAARRHLLRPTIVVLRPPRP